MADDARGAFGAEAIDPSFLSGANAAYAEAMQARYAADPQSVPASWRSWFASQGEIAAPTGPSWARADWPKAQASELTAVLDGNWVALEPKLEKKIAE